MSSIFDGTFISIGVKPTVGQPVKIKTLWDNSFLIVGVSAHVESYIKYLKFRKGLCDGEVVGAVVGSNNRLWLVKHISDNEIGVYSIIELCPADATQPPAELGDADRDGGADE